MARTEALDGLALVLRDVADLARRLEAAGLDWDELRAARGRSTKREQQRRRRADTGRRGCCPECGRRAA